MNKLQSAVNLLSEFTIEQENRNSQALEFNEHHNQLVDDYEEVCDEFDALCTTHALTAANNKALIKELEDAKKSLAAVEDVNAYLSKQNEELQEYVGFKRKYQVASADLRKAKDQVKRLKSKPAAKAKPVKASVLSRLEKERDEYREKYNGLLDYYKVAPVPAGDIKCQGFHIEMIDTQWRKMDVEVDGKKDQMKVQRLLMINNYNDVVCLMRVEGMDGVHTVKVPEGGSIEANGELFDRAQEYFRKYDKHYGVEK